MPNDVKLEACPFCGGDAKFHDRATRQKWDYGPDALVECETCAASLYRETDAEAIAAWNIRTQPPTDNAGGEVGIVAALVRVGHCVSEAEARRLVQGGGAYINDCKADESSLAVPGDKISAGKRHHATLNQSPAAPDREATIPRALVVAMEDFLNEPPRRWDIEPMDVRDYRHEAYRVWEPLCRAILALSSSAGEG